MDVFISYSSKDKETASLLVDFLTQKQVSCWFDESELKVGDDISLSISKALDQANIVIILLSKNSSKASWLNAELALALSKNKKVIPLITSDNVEIPPLLSSLKGLHAFTKEQLESASEEISQLLKQPSFEVDLKVQVESLEAQRNLLKLNKEAYLSVEQARFKELKARSFSLFFSSMCFASIIAIVLIDRTSITWIDNSLIVGLLAGAMTVELGHYFRKSIFKKGGDSKSTLNEHNGGTQNE